MTQTSFTFKLTVPRNPALGQIIADVVAHAVTYAAMNEAAGAAFVQAVWTAGAAELCAGGSPMCLVVVACDDGELRVTIGSQTLSQRISA